MLLIGNSTISRALKNLVPNAIIAGRKDSDIYFDLNENQSLPWSESLVYTIANFSEDLAEAMKTNVYDFTRFCELERTDHFIFISSVDVNKNSSYSITKRLAEEVLFFKQIETKTPLTILRPTRLLSADPQSVSHQPFFYDLLRKIKNNEKVSVTQTYRNFLFVEDLAKIILKVIEKRITGVYPCYFPTNFFYPILAQIAKEVLNSSSEIEIDLDGQSFICSSEPILDLSLYNKINWFPQIGMKEMIERIDKAGLL